MLSGPDLADLIAYAKSRGAKIILAGDVSQLQAVENGGGMSLLASTARLRPPRRTRPVPPRLGTGRQPAAPRRGHQPCWPSTTSTPGSSAGNRSR